MLCIRIVDHLLERAFREVGERRGGLLQTQEPFGRHHDERAAGGVQRLTSEQMEVLPRCRGIGHPDVLLRGELEEPFQPCA